MLTKWLKSNDPELLDGLLSAKSPTDIKSITQRNNSYVQKFCVVFLDLSGFSKATKTQGDFEALRMVLVAETMIANLASEKCGELVKSIGDSWLLVFQEAKDAFAFMESLYTGLHKVNQQNPNHLDVIPCGGLAYGPLLKFDQQDILGKTVNTAAVAGEDTAGPWEVLIAESALEQVKLEALLEPTSHIIGGEKISCWMPVKPE